jgi:hypothetical protein
VRQKRKERDTVLKKQAGSLKKRKQTALVGDDAEYYNEEPETNTSSSHNLSTKSKLTSDTLPDLLPDEYLEEAEIQSAIESDLDSEQPTMRVRKRNLKDLAEKKVKDRRVGSTTYRLSEVSSKLLAPKSSYHARTNKEACLNGRLGTGKRVGSAKGSGGGKRLVTGGGFFKAV